MDVQHILESLGLSHISQAIPLARSYSRWKPSGKSPASWGEVDLLLLSVSDGAELRLPTSSKGRGFSRVAVARAWSSVGDYHARRTPAGDDVFAIVSVDLEGWRFGRKEISGLVDFATRSDLAKLGLPMAKNIALLDEERRLAVPTPESALWDDVEWRPEIDFNDILPPYGWSDQLIPEDDFLVGSGVLVPFIGEAWVELFKRERTSRGGDDVDDWFTILALDSGGPFDITFDDSRTVAVGCPIDSEGRLRHEDTVVVFG